VRRIRTRMPPAGFWRRSHRRSGLSSR
jgi:hypothetical protein